MQKKGNPTNVKEDHRPDPRSRAGTGHRLHRQVAGNAGKQRRAPPHWRIGHRPVYRHGHQCVFQPNKTTAPGIKFTSKKVLKFAIVLLGASLNIRTVLTVGRFSLTVMLFTLATCFGLGALIGKALGLNWKTSSLINAGTGICGGSAIAAIAPVIEADDMDIAYGMSATFLFDTVMIVVFPLLGRWLGLSDAAFGLWAGTAVNDTSSVVATGYAFSEAAGDFATMVKLTRTLAIIPAVLVFAAINLHLKRKRVPRPTVSRCASVPFSPGSSLRSLPCLC